MDGFYEIGRSLAGCMQLVKIIPFCNVINLDHISEYEGKHSNLTEKHIRD